MMATRSGLLSYGVANAGLGWIVTGVLSVLALERALSGDLLWAGLAATAVAVALVPPAVSRRPAEMIAWEVLAIAALPVVARSVGLYVESVAYIAVAALALVVAVELDAFTAVEMTPEFAVAFVVIATMGFAGLWTIAQYASDVYLGTSLLVDVPGVMWDLVGATAVGVAAGVLFELYFRRISPGHALPREPWGVER